MRKLIINWNADGVDVNKFKEIQRFSNELTDDILKGSFKSKQSEPNPSVSITQGLILSNNLNRKYMKRLRSYQVRKIKSLLQIRFRMNLQKSFRVREKIFKFLTIF